MKQLLFTILLSLTFIAAFAQDEEKTFRKNEISLAPYGLNQIYFNSSANDGWLKSEAPDDMLLTNYRRWLNESTALRLGGNIEVINLTNVPLSVSLEARIGLEKYLSLSEKWQLYGGGEFRTGVFGLFNDFFSSFGVGVAGIGGIRYNINERWSLSSEILTPIGYGKSQSLDISSWSTGIEWQIVKINFRF